LNYFMGISDKRFFQLAFGNGGTVAEKEKEKFSIFDWFATLIGVVVVGFIVFILIWPLIDPTPDRSATIQENLHSITKPEEN